MELLQEKAYRVLHLGENEKSGSAAQALTSGPRRQLVRHVHYAPGEPRPVEDEAHDDSIKLSGETRTVLQSLHLFPNLESFRLDLQGWELGDYPQGPLYYSFEGPNPEDEEPWRALLNDSFLALCSSAGAFAALGVYHLPPISDFPAYSALRTDGWRTLLGNIKELDIQLAEIPGGGASNMTCNHQLFVSLLEDNFLGDLLNVEHLRVAGREDACIGSYKHKYREPIAWQSIQLPKIRVFELEWSRIDDEASLVVETSLETLERVYLRDCFATSKALWWRFFRNMANSDPFKLVEFEVLPARPYGENDSGDGSHPGDKDGDHSDDIDMRGPNNDDDRTGRECDARKSIRHRRFLSLDVNESYGDLHLIDHGWDEEDGEGGSDDEHVSESRVLEQLSRVHALVDRNRRAAGLST